MPTNRLELIARETTFTKVLEGCLFLEPEVSLKQKEQITTVSRKRQAV